MAAWLMEHETGMSKGDRLVAGHLFSESEMDRLALAAGTHRGGEPIQYVLGKAWFDGMELVARSGALIPRPETEELVADVAAKLVAAGWDDPFVVDWCTGSGCMALALKRRFEKAEVWGVDVSEEALSVAKENGTRLSLNVRWRQSDLLRAPLKLPRPAQVVVANPPYVPLEDRHAMADHVLDHEPHLALFVKDDNPLEFGHALVHWAEDEGLESGGWLAMECHASGAPVLASWLKGRPGWEDVDILWDMQGKPRHVIARRCLPSTS